jgi:hypothetical protein
VVVGSCRGAATVVAWIWASGRRRIMEREEEEVCLRLNSVGPIRCGREREWTLVRLVWTARPGCWFGGTT